MSRLLILPTLVAGALLLWLWASGGFDQIAAFAASEQRGFQNQIARNLRGLRAGDDTALVALLAVCFAYGFFHAVGPGHGKVLIGGYGFGRRVPWARLGAIGLASSLGQAVTAVVLVYAGVLVFDLTRTHLIGMTERVMAPLSYAAIALIGMWLVWRGTRRLRQEGHVHDHGKHCGHRHGPTADEIDQVGSPREALALIFSIAARPCTGALFVLIITWQMGIAAAGIAGAFAMALGTATVTVAVGLASAGMRGGLVATIQSSRTAAVAVPMVEMAAGLFIAVIAGGLLLRAI